MPSKRNDSKVRISQKVLCHSGTHSDHRGNIKQRFAVNAKICCGYQAKSSYGVMATELVTIVSVNSKGGETRKDTRAQL